jgi:hypothetical protein
MLGARRHGDQISLILYLIHHHSCSRHHRSAQSTCDLVLGTTPVRVDGCESVAASKARNAKRTQERSNYPFLHSSGDSHPRAPSGRLFGRRRDAPRHAELDLLRLLGLLFGHRRRLLGENGDALSTEVPREGEGTDEQ